MDRILEKEYTGEGLDRSYDNSAWMVGIKNFRPDNALDKISRLERHNKTDELFVLLKGNCTLVYADEQDGKLTFGMIFMLPYKIYIIPRSLWHNTVTEQDTKLLLIESSGTSPENSDIHDLNADEARTLRNICQRTLYL